MTNKSFISRDFWKEFNRYNISSFNAVPYTYEIINKLKIKNLFKFHVKYLTQAGGHLSKEIKNIIKDCIKKNKALLYVWFNRSFTQNILFRSKVYF